MSAKNNQPDWDKIAEKFDIFLPQIAPVGEALLEALDARPGDKVLDLVPVGLIVLGTHAVLPMFC